MKLFTCFTMLTLLFITAFVVVIEAGKTIGPKDRSYAQQRETAKIKYNIATIQSQLAEKAPTVENVGFIFGNPESKYVLGLYVSFSTTHYDSC